MHTQQVKVPAEGSYAYLLVSHTLLVWQSYLAHLAVEVPWLGSAAQAGQLGAQQARALPGQGFGQRAERRSAGPEQAPEQAPQG